MFKRNCIKIYYVTEPLKVFTKVIQEVNVECDQSVLAMLFESSGRTFLELHNQLWYKIATVQALARNIGRGADEE